MKRLKANYVNGDQLWRQKRKVEQRLRDQLDELGVDRVMNPAEAVRAIEFGAVGIISSVVNLLTFIVSISFIHYLIAGTLAFFVGITVSFKFNRLITFDSPEGSPVIQYTKYIAVSTGGYILYLCGLYFGLQVLYLPYLLAGALATAGGGVWNFVGSNRYAFSG